MFAKLKKKIEEEVGDLGQLTSPLANPFGSGDKRVGGSTQGTNTPNNLGSRQSSIASLVDLPLQNEPTSPSSALLNFSLPVPLTPTPVVSPRGQNTGGHQRSPSNFDAELKKANADWIKKYESMKKSYEERLQNQEADFAWKYGSKEEELERLRVDKRKAEELIRTMEGSYQNKMTRVQDDMDQLEGFTKQEMAKVKHLLLNTQADLQKAQSENVEQSNAVKEANEEIKKLKAENDSILRNLDRDKLNRLKFEAEQAETANHLENLREEIQRRDKALSELRLSLEDSLKSSQELTEENQKLKSERNANQKLNADNEEKVKDVESLKGRIRELEVKLNDKNKLLNTQAADLQKAESENAEQSNAAKEANEEIKKLKAENESILRNLDRDKLDRLKFEAEQAETASHLENLREEIQRRDKTLSELRLSLEASLQSTQELTEENQKLKSERNGSQKLNADNEEKVKDVENFKERIRELEVKLDDKNKVLNNTQADLQKAQSENVEQSNAAKEANEEIKKLKAENESILRNLDRDKLNRSKFEAEQAETANHLENLRKEIHRRDTALSELRLSLEASLKSTQELTEENQKLKSEMNADNEKEAEDVDSFKERIRELEVKLDDKNKLLNTQADLQKAQSNATKEANEEIKKLKAENESILRNLDRDKLNRLKFEAEQAETVSHLENLREEIQRRDKALSELRLSLEASLKSSQELTEENQKLKSERNGNQKLNADNEEEVEDVESFKERIRELEVKLNDKNKALKLRQQQLQDLRKTLAKEMKSSSSSSSSVGAATVPALFLQAPPEPSAEYLVKSQTQISLTSSANDVRVEEFSSQTETEPAVIPNSHHDASYSYANDVNFQYMKSVIFKFVTSPDPQVTHHLTKVVSTLLHLSDEEARILEKCTDKKLLTWLGSRENQGF